MADPGAVLADLTAESADLDAAVAGLTDGDWAHPTPGAGRRIAALAYVDATLVPHVAALPDGTRLGISPASETLVLQGVSALSLLPPVAGPTRRMPLGTIAGARSGDKGGSAAARDCGISCFAPGIVASPARVATIMGAFRRLPWRRTPSSRAPSQPGSPGSLRRQRQLEQAKLMMQKAATLYDGGDDTGAGEAANMAKYAAAEVRRPGGRPGGADPGGNGFASEYGLGAQLATARVGRVAPVSREMILNFVTQFSLGLPKSY